MILRKDAWSHEEDLVIKDTVLAFAKEGRTQKEAFQYVNAQLPKRTYSAINQRWNKYLKSQALRIYQREADAEIQEEAPVEHVAEHVESVVKVDSNVLTLCEIERIMNLPNLDHHSINMLNIKLRELIKPLSPLLKV